MYFITGANVPTILSRNNEIQTFATNNSMTDPNRERVSKLVKFEVSEFHNRHSVVGGGVGFVRQDKVAGHVCQI